MRVLNGLLLIRIPFGVEELEGRALLIARASIHVCCTASRSLRLTSASVLGMLQVYVSEVYRELLRRLGLGMSHQKGWAEPYKNTLKDPYKDLSKQFLLKPESILQTFLIM